MQRTTRIAVAIAIALWLSPLQPASALDSPADGKALAGQWCSSCHLVSPDQPGASADAPTFMTIARRPDEYLDRLPAFLLDPHPKMPNFYLSRQQIGDLLAYIRSLR